MEFEKQIKAVCWRVKKISRWIQYIVNYVKYCCQFVDLSSLLCFQICILVSYFELCILLFTMYKSILNKFRCTPIGLVKYLMLTGQLSCDHHYQFYVSNFVVLMLFSGFCFVSLYVTHLHDREDCYAICTWLSILLVDYRKYSACDCCTNFYVR